MASAQIMRKSLRPYSVMGMLVALLLAIAAGAGVYDKGIYRPFLDESFVDFQFFQDLVSLIFVPLLVSAVYFTHRGSRRAFVLWAGVMVYVTYYYAFYCFGYVYTAYYPLYLALMGLGAYSLIGLLTSEVARTFQAAVSAKMPVRFIAIVLGMTVLFVPIWFSMIVRGINTHQVQTTDLVFVLDLPFLIPACVLAAVQVWRRRSIGYLLSGPLLFKATISGMLLTGGEMLKLQRGLPLAYDQLAMYLFLAVVGLAGLVFYMLHLEAQGGIDVQHHSVRSSLGQGGW
jgi:hypothetical protein